MFHFYIYLTSKSGTSPDTLRYLIADPSHETHHPSTKAPAQGPHIHKEMSGMSEMLSVVQIPTPNEELSDQSQDL